MSKKTNCLAALRRIWISESTTHLVKHMYKKRPSEMRISWYEKLNPRPSAQLTWEMYHMLFEFPWSLCDFPCHQASLVTIPILRRRSQQIKQMLLPSGVPKRLAMLAVRVLAEDEVATGAKMDFETR